MHDTAPHFDAVMSTSKSDLAVWKEQREPTTSMFVNNQTGSYIGL